MDCKKQNCNINWYYFHKLVDVHIKPIPIDDPDIHILGLRTMLFRSPEWKNGIKKRNKINPTNAPPSYAYDEKDISSFRGYELRIENKCKCKCKCNSYRRDKTRDPLCVSSPWLPPSKRDKRIRRLGLKSGYWGLPVHIKFPITYKKKKYDADIEVDSYYLVRMCRKCLKPRNKTKKIKKKS